MFSAMKLQTKMSLGFSTVLGIVAVVGGISISQMQAVQELADGIAKGRVPEVKAANNMERYALMTMYSIQGYTLSGQKSFLEDGRKNLNEVSRYIKEASNLAAAINAADLRQSAQNCAEYVKTYEMLLAQTVSLMDETEQGRTACADGAALFMRNCYDYLKSQEAKLREEAVSREVASGEAPKAGENPAPGAGSQASSAPAAVQSKVLDLYEKTVAINDVIDLGNGIVLSTWKSEAQKDPKCIQESLKSFDEIEKKLEWIRARTKQDVNLRQLEEIQKGELAYKAAMTKIAANMVAMTAINTAREKAADKVIEEAKMSTLNGVRDAETAAMAAGTAMTVTSQTLIGGIAAAMILGIVFAFLITANITKSLARIFKGLKSFSTEELGGTQRRMTSVIEGMEKGSGQVASAAGQIAEASQHLAEGASEQASSLEETSASIEEITSMVKQNTENAKQAKHVAKAALASAEKSQSAVGRMNDAIQQIKESSDQTAKIIKTIDEIAFQTNLLALNAAVEAARAGDAGKGFAVVAEEVRNLAQRSAEAAKTTAALIQESQENSENGVKVAGEVSEILKEIGTSVRKVTQLVEEVAAASEEQTRGIEQVNTAITEMDKVTQSNASSAEESASASEELSAQARDLSDMVGVLIEILEGENVRKRGKAPSGDGHSWVQAAGRPPVHTRKQPRGKSSKPFFHGDQNEQRILAAAGRGRLEEVIPLSDEEIKEF